MEFIDELANVIYNKENIERANQYLIKRGINPQQLKFPYTLTDDVEANFWRFRQDFPPQIFLNNLYIPIIDIKDHTKLVGFDVRYIGDDPRRVKFNKFKRGKDYTFIYNFCSFRENLDRPILVLESALDVESVRGLGLNLTCISFLSAIHHLRSVLFLYGMAEKIYYMYDNDKAGNTAIKRIIKHVSFSTDIMRKFNFINYKGKDANETLTIFGSDYLRNTIESQI
jgi:hypothetical protein